GIIGLHFVDFDHIPDYESAWVGNAITSDYAHIVQSERRFWPDRDFELGRTCRRDRHWLSVLHLHDRLGLEPRMIEIELVDLLEIAPRKYHFDGGSLHAAGREHR